MSLIGASTTWVRLPLVVVFAAFASGACSDVIGPGEEPMDQIFFVSTRDGVRANGEDLSDIYRMNVDGSGVENVTHYPTTYGMTASPDGRTVLVSAFRPRPVSGWTYETCPSQIWSLAANGSLRQVTHAPGCHSFAILSPNATQFAYTRGNDFFVANVDGSAARQVPYTLSPVTQSCSATEPPKWSIQLAGWASPARLKFHRHICGVGYTYYSMNLDGSDLRVIDADVYNGRISPDGQRIVFGRAGHVWVSDVDGSGARVVVQNAEVDGKPWSPDGKRIYVRTAEAGLIANVDGDPAVVRLTLPQVHFAQFNGWSPRGDRLAFTLYTRTSETEYTYVLDIYVVNSDGTGGVVLTDGKSWNRNAVWMRGR